MKHDKHMTKKRHKNDRKMLKLQENEICQKLVVFVPFFCHVYCHCPAIVLSLPFFFFNQFFNFLAWKQQNHWTIEENQWTN